MCFRLCINIHITFYSAQAPEILIFKIGTVTPAVNFHSDLIISRFYKRRDIKLRRCFCVFVIPHFFPIDPHVKSTGNSAKIQLDLLILPILRNLEFSLIRTYRVINRIYKRWIDRVCITGAHIQRKIVTLHLPISRNVNIIPIGSFKFWLIKILWALLWSICKIKLPSSV